MSEKNFLTDLFHISEARFSMLFSYDNVMGVFRSNGENDDVVHDTNSEHYELVYFTAYDSEAPEDVLRDLSFYLRAGKLKVCVNDIIAIRINGFLSCYRYCKSIQKQMNLKNTVMDEFIDLPDFLIKEKLRYIQNVHDERMVISVLDGQLFPIGELSAMTRKLYCIEKEIFSPPGRKNSVVSNYSLYTLNHAGIHAINPFDRPFVTMKNALFHYYRSKRRDPRAVLLYNKQELEMVRDYNDLKHIELIL